MRRVAPFIAPLALLALATPAVAGQDRQAPTTAATVVPAGSQTVRVTLRAVDRGGSGVRGIHYVLPSWRSFRIYRGPFVIRRGTLFLVSAFDRAGNDEDFKQVRGLPGARVEPIALTKANREAGDANRAEGQLRAAVPAIEVYFVDHGGSYAGMTAEKLRAIDPLMTGIDVLSASRSAYCVRGRAGSVTLYKRGPAGEISRTPCH